MKSDTDAPKLTAKTKSLCLGRSCSADVVRLQIWGTTGPLTVVSRVEVTITLFWPLDMHPKHIRVVLLWKKQCPKTMDQNSP